MSEDRLPNRAASRLYPEVAAGGFTRHDGFVDFYFRVSTLIGPDSVVLDFGAGRGAWTDVDLAPAHRELRDLQSKAKRVVGVDVDDVVLQNPTLDEAHLIKPGEPLPLEAESFDLVVSDYVLEHITHEDAPGVAAEMHRVLKPGGWFAARTPNKWGVIGLGARAVPNDLHVKVLGRLQPGRNAFDVFPTKYAMNTRRDLRRLFPTESWELAVYGHASEPQYAGSSVAAWRAASFIDRITPPPLLPTLMIFARKRP